MNSMEADGHRHAYLAHISEDGVRVQTVLEHLRGTAQLAAKFAAPFGAEQAGQAAGLLHDIGKYSSAFQRRIRGGSITVDHSTAGAKEAYRAGQLELAFAIAGHHGGIPEGGNRRFDTGDAPTLFGRIKKELEPYDAWKDELNPPEVQLPAAFRTDGFTNAFYIRMLYSCLVDADFQDTETFMDGSKAPRGEYESIPALLEKVRARANRWLNAPAEHEIYATRNRVLRSCMEQGSSQVPGLFTLTVPTGGGKTFSSLAFALEHAAQHKMDRVIYVIPYTSIIDQTVGQFKELLGEANVLGHYASADYRLKDEENLSPEDYRCILAAENWDMPVIVTTAVQFFESLFADRASRCRKLHNIANSVLIFDEAQTLPVNYLYPCVAAISQLVQHYHASAVLCTATQPALNGIFRTFAPDMPLREICTDSVALYAILKRTTLQNLGPLEEAELAQRLRTHQQVLCVVNRRRTAQVLFEALPEEGSYCLTTLLCPRDRKRLLDEIRSRLKAGAPCKVVSTSLIEAGVDVDFPTAYREEAGLDSILQTAGRCNREGKRTAEESTVYIFSIKGNKPLPILAQNLGAFHTVKRRYPERLDTPEAIEAYFHQLYYLKGEEALDAKGILPAFQRGLNGSVMPFRQVDSLFKLIETPTKAIYIPIGRGEGLCQQLLRHEYSSSLYRQLGEYSVCVYPGHFQALMRAGALEAVDEQGAVLSCPDYYSSKTGLTMDVEMGAGLFI